MKNLLCCVFVHFCRLLVTFDRYLVVCLNHVRRLKFRIGPYLLIMLLQAGLLGKVNALKASVQVTYMMDVVFHDSINKVAQQ